MQNPQLMAELMQNPAIQQSMETLMSNPQMLEQMMAANPMFGGNREMVSGGMTTPIFGGNHQMVSIRRGSH